MGKGKKGKVPRQSIKEPKNEQAPHAGRATPKHAAGNAEGAGKLEALLERARHAVDTLQPELALQFYQRALQSQPGDTAVMEETAELMLQLGQLEQAEEVLVRAISLSPEEGPAKWLYLAQLQEGDDSLRSYQKGIALLRRDMSNPGEATEELILLRRQQLCTACCSVAELYMTDLCFNEDAEQQCQLALDQAIESDYGGPEPLQALASLRLSQSRPEEAVGYIKDAAKRLAKTDPPPDYEFRVSTAKILLECSEVENDCCEHALDVLSGLLQEDDENIEIWYLMGLAFFRMQPADLEYSREYLEKARDMLAKLRETHGPGEEASYEGLVHLVEEQLELLAQAEAEASVGADMDDGSDDVQETTADSDVEPDQTMET